MKKSLHTLMVLGVAASVFALGVSPAAVQEPPGEAAAPPPGTYSASCLVRISSVGAVALDDDTVEALLNSTGVLTEAVRKVLGQPASRIDDMLNVSFSRVGPAALPTRAQRGSGRGGPAFEHTILGRIEVEIFEDEDAKPVAEELLAQICMRLSMAVRTLADPEREQLEEELAFAQRGLERAERRLEELREVQQRLWEQARAAGLPRTDILDKIHNYEEELQSIEFDLAGLTARGEALTEQIAKIAQQIEAAPKTDEVTGELEKVVALREKELNRIQSLVEKQLASDQEVGQALEPVALARAELAKQRQTIAQAAGGNLLAEFNRDLIKLSIETAEMEARREFLQSKLAMIKERNLLELADRYEEDVTAQLPVALKAVASATQRHDDLEHELRTFRAPTVTIVGGS
jgi:hypothetical protein